VVFPIVVLALIICIPSWGQDGDWNRVAKLSTRDPILVLQRDGPSVEGEFRSWSPENLLVESRKQVRSITLVSIRQVLVRRKASLWKAVGIGAAIGFGIAFSGGAASAGYLTDRNSPKFVTRAGVGAGLGLLGAGIGAGLGAIAGGFRFETLYRRR